MYRVVVTYTVGLTGGRQSMQYKDEWIVKQAPSADHAVDEAVSNSAITAGTRHGWGASVSLEDVAVSELFACVPCAGTGNLPTMEGFNICPTCGGKRYIEVEHVSG